MNAFWGWLRRLLRTEERIPAPEVHEKRSFAFHEGYLAYELGGRPEVNPHQLGTAEHEDWADGWFMAHGIYVKAAKARSG